MVLKPLTQKWITRLKRLPVIVLVGLSGAGAAVMTRAGLEKAALDAWKSTEASKHDTAVFWKSRSYDAFRHAYTSARLTQVFGARATRLLMDGNEIIGMNDKAERAKDIYNNDISSALWGSRPSAGLLSVDTALANRITASMASGQIKTHVDSVPAAQKRAPFAPVKL